MDDVCGSVDAFLLVCSIFFGGIYSQHGASLLDRKDEVSFFLCLPIIRTPLQGGFLGAAQPVNMNHQPTG